MGDPASTNAYRNQLLRQDRLAAELAIRQDEAAKDNTRTQSAHETKHEMHLCRA